MSTALRTILDFSKMCCFCATKNLFTGSIYNGFQNKSESEVDFGCTFELSKDVIRVLVNQRIFESWHSVFDYWMSSFFELRVYHKKLTCLQISLKFRIVSVSTKKSRPFLEKFRNCMLIAFLLSQIIETRKLLLPRFIREGNNTFFSAVFLGWMTLQVSLGDFWGVEAFSAIQGWNSTFFFKSCKIRFGSLVPKLSHVTFSLWLWEEIWEKLVQQEKMKQTLRKYQRDFSIAQELTVKNLASVTH